VPKALIENAQHWQKRAEEARALAARLRDPTERRTMLDIAHNYDQLALHAQQRADHSRQQKGDGNAALRK
jgi:hypothetical protein